MREACEACGHSLGLHFDAVNGGPGKCQEDVMTLDLGGYRVEPCTCKQAPQDARHAPGPPPATCFLPPPGGE